jgi:type I restriction enzyme S subunit
METNELPKNWEWSTIIEVCDTVFGQSPPSASYNLEGKGLPFFQGKAEFGERYPSVAKWCTEPTREAESGDILISVRAPVGPTNIAKERCAIGRGLAAIKPSIERGYVEYWLKRSEQALAAQGTGTTFSAITKRVLNSHPIPVAPLSEQRRIVEKIETLFAELDKGEEALREVQKLLARYRQSVLKAAVTGELIGKGSADWTPVAMGDLLEDIRYGTAKKCWPDGEGSAVLRIPNVVGSEIDLTDLKFTSLTKKELEKLSLREGDILIVRSNGSANLVGRGAIVTSDAVGMAYAGYLIRLRLDRKRVSPAFLHIVLNSPAIRARIERQAKSTSGVHNLNSAETKAIAFDLPDLETQGAVVEAVQEALSRIAQGEAWCETELKRSAALRQSILKNAFSGKLVPQDPSDEPAEKLLDRIRNTRKASQKRALA